MVDWRLFHRSQPRKIFVSFVSYTEAEGRARHAGYTPIKREYNISRKQYVVTARPNRYAI